MASERHCGAPKIRLFLVDDEPVVRRGLELLIGVEPNLEVCGVAEGEAEALERIAASRPHLAVVDLGLKQGSGLSLIKRLRQRYPALRILVFSMHNQPRYVSAAFAAGAHGYVAKDEGTDKVLEALRLVSQGSQYLSEEFGSRMPSLQFGAGSDARQRRAN